MTLSLPAENTGAAAAGSGLPVLPAHTSLPVENVPDVAAIMVNGTIRQIGRPDEVERELSAAYLGG